MSLADATRTGSWKKNARLGEGDLFGDWLDIFSKILSENLSVDCNEFV